MPKWTKEQELAINTEGSNIIISAGAGSGKTAVLTERVITKLKNGTHINELLILTFTNNAAAEMKERIKKAISKIPELSEEMNLIESASITTFDAYVLSLVKKYHYYLNLDAGLSIIDSSIIKLEKQKIIDQIFASKYQENNQNFINFVTKYCIKNDKILRKKILSLDSSLDLIINKEEYISNYIENYYSEDNLNSLFKSYESLILNKVNSIKNSLENMGYEIEEKAYQKFYTVLSPLIKSTSYDEIRSSINFTMPRLPNGSTEKAKYYKTQISEIAKSIKELCYYNKEALLNNLKSTKNDASIIIEIIKELHQKTENYKYSKNMFEFNDISKLAIKLIKSNELVRENLKNSFKEIMIDEYQDTSNMQETFISLIENNNVYMVGDVKQSIYRFRNANPDIFKIKYDKYKNNDGGIKIDLNKNFRSREQVLDSINEIFNHIMDDFIGNANYQKEHKLIFGNQGFYIFGSNKYNNNLEIYNYEKDKDHTKEEIEAFIIGNDIKDKINAKYQVLDEETQRDITYKDFCILMDRTSSFDIYKKVFDYLQIPLNIYKDEDILFTDEVCLINNILGLIINIKKEGNSTSNKFYYTSIARSYLYSIEDETIYQTITNNKIKETDIYQKCLEISKNIDSMSNYEIIETIINEFNFYNKMITVGNLNYRTIILNNLLNKAQNLNDVGMNIYDMKDFFENLMENQEVIKLPAIISDSNSVTITNIHKSKGLEYKICYFSGFHKEFNLQDMKDKILYSNAYGLIMPSYNEGFSNTFIKTIFKEDNVKNEISEKIRLLYVALTRAKEKMIIVTSLDNDKFYITNSSNVIDDLDRMKYKSFKDILNSVYTYIEKYITNIPIPLINNEYKIAKNINLNDLNNSKEIINVEEKELAKETLKENHFSKEENKLITNEEKENMKFGTNLHYMLENINLKDPNYNILNDNEKSILSNLLKNSIFSNINNAKIYQEYEFIDIKENEEKVGVIDLMLEYDDHIDIIDYKLKHTDDPAYKKQLDGYKSFIESKTHKKTFTYLYSLTTRTLTKID